MQTQDLPGKTITNIYLLYKAEPGGLDTAECFVELDHQWIIDLPFSPGGIYLKELHKDAVSIFSDPVKKGLWGSLRRMFTPDDPQPLKHIRNRKITDFLWYENDTEKGLLLLDNGSLITETLIAPHGTGLAGLRYYSGLKDLADMRGKNYLRLAHSPG